MMRQQAGAPMLAVLLTTLLLAGCGDGGTGEIRTWMEQVKKETVPRVKPLPEPKSFVPHAYNQREAMEPFDQVKLLGEAARGRAGNANRPDMDRPREVLENYPLDTMRMVGTMQKGGVTFALLQVERTLYRVRAGQRIGQNFGRITRVGAEAIEIRETVEDATGDWVERIAHIELHENKESGK